MSTTQTEPIEEVLEQGEMPILEVKVAYSESLLVQAATPQDAAIAAFLKSGLGHQFSGDEKKSYVNIYTDDGVAIHSVPVERWLAEGRKFISTVQSQCKECALEEGLVEGSKEWQEFVSAKQASQFAAVGLVA